MKIALIRSKYLKHRVIAIIFLAQFFLNPSALAATSGSGICQQTYTRSAGSESVTVTASGDYCYVAFKNLGAADATASTYTWTKPSGITSLDVLVVGGGGGGGARHGGGGGAGSFVQATSFAVSSGSTNISIIVGSGGAGANPSNSSYVGSTGGTSSFKIGANGLTALGGGGGQNSNANVSGGSGGGAGANQTAGSALTSTQKTLDGLTTISGIEFGSAGASGVADPNSGTSNNKDYWAAGGGGGAGGAGKRPTQDGSEYISSNTFNDGDGSRTRGGDGGSGKVSSIVPDVVATSLGIGQVFSGSTYFAAGGGGGIGNDGISGGNGGTGGGGNGTRAIATGGIAAITSTGSGGGGSGYDDISPVTGDTTNPPGGSGSSGVVVIRFIPSAPTISASAAISGTTTYGQVISSNTGSWNYGATSYTYQWSRAASIGGSYTAIPGATSSIYTLAAADVGQFLKVAVTATNIVGSTTDTSAATAAISAASSSSSVSLTVGNLFFRTTKSVSATPTVAGKLTFRANNVVIAGCKNLAALANIAKSCNYRPNSRGYVTISVTLVPTNGGYATTTSSSDRLFVYQRSGNR